MQSRIDDDDGGQEAEGSEVAEIEQSSRNFGKLNRTKDHSEFLDAMKVVKNRAGRASDTSKSLQEECKSIEVSDQDEEPARKLGGDIQDLYEWIETSQWVRVIVILPLLLT